jgi:hypothetical protein
LQRLGRTLVGMNISLEWKDLIKLAANGTVEKEGVTVTVKRPLLPELQISPDGQKGFVKFTVDESDPRSNAV